MKKSLTAVILLTRLVFTGCASSPETAVELPSAVLIQAAAEPPKTAEAEAARAEATAPEAGPGWSVRATRAAAETSVQVSKQAGERAARTASQLGTSLGTAYRGVRSGFETPTEIANFGSFPDAYAQRIRDHLIRFEGVREDASIRIDVPEPGYMNAGLFQGGRISWRGYLVDVDVETPAGRVSQARKSSYVVRMRDDEIIEIHRASTASALRRAPPSEASSAAAAPAR